MPDHRPLIGADRPTSLVFLSHDVVAMVSAGQLCTTPGAHVFDASLLHRVTHVIDIDGFFLRDGSFHPKETCVLDVHTGVAIRFESRLPVPYARLSAKDRTSVAYVSRNVHGIKWTNDTRPINDTRRADDTRRTNDSSTTTTAQLDAHARQRFMLSSWAELQRAICDYVWRVYYANDFAKLPPLFAYKGGHLEVDLLAPCGFHTVNLEMFGCPKYDTLVSGCPKLYQSPHSDRSTAAGWSTAEDATRAIPHHDLLHRREAVFGGQLVYLHQKPCDLHHYRYDRSGQRRLHCPAEECRVFARWILHAIEASAATTAAQ